MKFYPRLFLSNIKFTFFLVFPTFLYGIDPSISSLKKIDGFESSFFSSETGFKYLKIKYQDTSTERPKLGFLKFGLAFLKVKDLRVFLDLRHANGKILFNKWEELVENKAIKYATMEPFMLNLVQQAGNTMSLEASKGKLSSTGQLKLWGGVVCRSPDGLEERLNQVVISLNNLTNELEIIKGTEKAQKLRFSFKESETEKNP